MARHCPRTIRRTQRRGRQFSSPDWIPNYLEPWPRETRPASISLFLVVVRNDTRIRPLSRGGNIAPRIYSIHRQQYSYIYIYKRTYSRLYPHFQQLVSENSQQAVSRHCALHCNPTPLTTASFLTLLPQGLLLDTILDILGPHHLQSCETPGHPFALFIRCRWHCVFAVSLWSRPFHCLA